MILNRCMQQNQCFHMTENVSKTPQDASKMFPDASDAPLKHLKTVQRRSQTAARRSKTPSDTLLGGVRRCFEGALSASMILDDVHTAEDARKTVKDGLKTLPRRLQDVSKTVQTVTKTLPGASKTPLNRNINV